MERALPRSALVERVLAGRPVAVNAAIASAGDHDVDRAGVLTSELVCLNGIKTFQTYDIPYETTDDFNIRGIGAHGDRERIVTVSKHNTLIWDLDGNVNVWSLPYDTDWSVSCACFAKREDNLLVTACSDRKIRVWSLPEGSLLKVLTGHKGKITSMCITDDLLLTASYDHKVMVWSLSTGHLVRTFQEHEDAVFALCLSDEGTYVMSGGADNTVKRWHLGTTTLFYSLKHTDLVSALCVTAGDKYLISACLNGSIQIWDFASGASLHSFVHTQGQSAAVVSNVYGSPDGRHFVTSSGSTLKIWKTSTGAHVRTLSHAHGVTASCISKNGDHLFVACGRKIVRCDWLSVSFACSDATLRRQPAEAVCYTFDRKFVVVVSRDRVRTFCARSGKESGVLVVGSDHIWYVLSDDGCSVVDKDYSELLFCPVIDLERKIEDEFHLVDSSTLMLPSISTVFNVLQLVALFNLPKILEQVFTGRVILPAAAEGGHPSALLYAMILGQTALVPRIAHIQPSAWHQRSETGYCAYDLLSDSTAVHYTSFVGRKNILTLPTYWSSQQLDCAVFHRLEVTEDLRRQMQDFLNATCNSSTLGKKFLKDQKVPGAYRQLNVQKVWRTENHALWFKYVARRKELEARAGTGTSTQILCSTDSLPLTSLLQIEQSDSLNEKLLFHGTSRALAETICVSGFDERVASLKGMLGGGIYFADQCSKSDQYVKPDDDNSLCYMFVSRVTMGRQIRTITEKPEKFKSESTEPWRLPPDGGDSVFFNAEDFLYREYVVYDRCQCYPEFLIAYKRV
eukprot:GILK01012405.1.p1 GENE.GILK01012405.1~~GILK01012405.1.p1  ORF type:complete len:795 (+),score=47.17 GILK01012405.1:40-2424(+)